MSEQQQSQQAFLRAAKEKLGLEWDDFAKALELSPKTFKNWRLPDESDNHRAMPNLARSAVQRLLDDHDAQGRKSRKRAA